MAARTLPVRLEYVNHDTGHWCRTCSLSTGLQVWVAVTSSTGMTLQQTVYCYECRGRDVVLEAS